jgi:hypothetical protein
MKPNRCGPWGYLLVLLAVALASACGTTEPPPVATPTPVLTPTPQVGTTQLSRFTATPSTITEGEEFTLAWEGTSGVVSISKTGGAPFLLGRPPTGSHVLRTGVSGYPTGTGQTTYEAANSDVGQRLHATVSVTAKVVNHDPTVIVTAAPTGCHPRHSTPTSCSVTCTANASDPDGDALSYSWSGCATGSNTTATCTVTEPGSHACTVAVTDTKGGSTAASATVQGTNEPPRISTGCWSRGAGCASTELLAGSGNCTGDAPTYRFFATDPDDPNPWSSITCSATPLPASQCSVCQCWPASYNSPPDVRFYLLVKAGAKGLCSVAVTITDDWGSATTETYSIPVN